jgi:hypothetical protein
MERNIYEKFDKVNGISSVIIIIRLENKKLLKKEYNKCIIIFKSHGIN